MAKKRAAMKATKAGAWSWNPLLHSLSGLETLLLSPYLRGAVSGLGAYLLLQGILELPSTRGPSRRR